MTAGDHPISSRVQDKLGRTRATHAIANLIRNTDASSGLVIGILGPWGSGKSSVLNLIAEGLREDPEVRWVEFNPWMFSGTDQLLERFFDELLAQFSGFTGQGRELAEKVHAYSTRLKPIAPVIEMIPGVGSAIASARDLAEAVSESAIAKKSLIELREEVREELAGLQGPIVVAIDDIDRLQKEEIREIFRLVRLTGNFPNVVYLLAFDRVRVEEALDDDGLPGGEYLEKIVQINFDLPLPPTEGFAQFVVDSLNDRLSTLDTPLSDIDHERWPSVFHNVILPQIENPRDVIRLTGALPIAIEMLVDRIDLVDILAMETIRLQNPSAFRILLQHTAILTRPVTSQSGRGSDTPFAEAQELASKLYLNEHLTNSIMQLLFPAAAEKLQQRYMSEGFENKWLRERRVAHFEILGYYATNAPSSVLSSYWRSQTALSKMTDATAFEQFLREIDASLWEDTIVSLEHHEDMFTPEMAIPISVTLLNLKPEMPDRERPILDFGIDLKIARVILRALKRLPDSEEVAKAVQKSLDNIHNLSGQLSLVRLIGHEANVGHELVEVDAAQELERKVRDRIRTAHPEQLADEQSVLGLLLWMKRTFPDEGPDTRVSKSPRLVAALLNGAHYHIRRRQIDGSVPIERQPALQYDQMVELIGDEDQLKAVINKHRDYLRETSPEALELFDHYADGNSPVLSRRYSL